MTVQQVEAREERQSSDGEQPPMPEAETTTDRQSGRRARNALLLANTFVWLGVIFVAFWFVF